MKKKAFLLISLGAAVLLSGCAPALKLHVKQPGEMNLAGVSKIAILGFDTLPGSPGSERFPVNEATLRLAEKCMTDVFYSVPFFCFSDLSIEPLLEKCSRSRRASRFDALVHGQVWWEISEEYNNVKPKTFSLQVHKPVSYICGFDKEGKPKYCRTMVLKEQRDEPKLLPYRAVKASLMLSLSLYKLNDDGMGGRIRKLTQVSEIASQQAMILNGVLHLLEPDIVGLEAKKDQAATLGARTPAQSKSRRGMSLDTQPTTPASTGNPSGASGGSGKGLMGKALDDLFKNLIPQTSSQTQASAPSVTKPAETSLRTIPAELQLQTDTMNAIVRVLHERIAPHEREFEVAFPFQMDTAAANLLVANAYMGAVHYIIRKKLSGGYEEVCEDFYEMELEKGAREVVSRLHRDALERENRAAPPDKQKEYVPMPPEELERRARDYLADRATDLYVLGLALEALGKYDQALDLYRYLFYNKKGMLLSAGADQDYADGIGRCLFALKMDKGLREGDRRKRNAMKGGAL